MYNQEYKITEPIKKPMITSACISPHPQITIPGIEDSEKHLVEKTIHAMEKLGESVKEKTPDVIAIISPHGPMRYDKFTINFSTNLHGNFAGFGTKELDYNFSSNKNLAKKILTALRKRDLPVEPIREPKLDHGSLVPLHFLTEQLEISPLIIPLTYTNFDPKMHFRFGKALGEIFDKLEERVCLVASGDLSHRLTEDAPAGFSPYGEKFDQTLIRLLEKGFDKQILEINPQLCEESGECGFRSIVMAAGALSHKKTPFQKLSYEHPFGVGHLVGEWEVG